MSLKTSVSVPIKEIDGHKVTNGAYTFTADRMMVENGDVTVSLSVKDVGGSVMTVSLAELVYAISVINEINAVPEGGPLDDLLEGDDD